MAAITEPGRIPLAPTPAGPAASGTMRVADVAERLTAKLPSYTPRYLAAKILTSRSAMEGERKQVTVLFADCVGFTELARAIDPEELHQVMDGCFEQLLAAVHRFEGTVNQFTGDGVGEQPEELLRARIRPLEVFAHDHDGRALRAP